MNKNLLKVQLIGPIGPKLKNLLDQSIIVPDETLANQDEVHLIMEYKVGDKWGDSSAPVATRFITSFDEANGKATSLEAFFSSISHFGSDLVILSGLHIMEGQSETIWKTRLNVVVNELRKIPDTIPVHLELASMANADYVKEIVTKVI